MPTKRRGHGEGSIFVRKDGSFCAALSLSTGPDGKRRRRYVYAASKAEARLKLEQLKVTIAMGARVNTHTDRTTVATYLRAWIASKEIREKTRVQYEWIVERYLVPRIGAIRLEDVDHAAVAAFLAQLRRDDPGDRTRQLCFDVLRAALNHAVIAKKLPSNPMLGTERPRVERREITPWLQSEANLVLEEARDDRFYALYVLELRLGLQFPGEVLGLRWDYDVDMKARKIRVGGQLATRGRKRAATKTVARRRELAMPGAVYDALVEHRARLLAEGLRSSPYVFPNREGKAQDSRNFVRDSFDPIVERAGRRRCAECTLPAAVHENLEAKPPIAKADVAACDEFRPGVRRVRPYDMRHTFATVALVADVHIKTVSRMLGHANEIETLRTYVHYVPSMLEDANERIDAIWERSIEPRTV